MLHNCFHETNDAILYVSCRCRGGAEWVEPCFQNTLMGVMVNQCCWRLVTYRKSDWGEYSAPLHESYMDYVALTLCTKWYVQRYALISYFFIPGVTGVMIAVWNPTCSWITSMTKACVMTFDDNCIFIYWHFEFLCTLPQMSPSSLVETLGCSVPRTRAKWTWLGRDPFDLNHPRPPSGRLLKGGNLRTERHAEREAASDSPWQQLRSGRKGYGLLIWRRVAYTP